MRRFVGEEANAGAAGPSGPQFVTGFDNPRESAIYCWQVLLPGEDPVIERSARQPATAEQPIVFVVDDDESVREALRSLFRSVSLRVETFGSAGDFLRSELPEVASCLVLDVRLPGVSGLDFQGELAKANIHIPVIFMTGHGDIPMSVQAMKAGAVDNMTGIWMFALASSPWKSSPLTPGNLTSSTRQLATSGSSLRKKSPAEPNVSTLRLTDRNRLLSASRTDSSSSTTNTIGCSAVAGWRAERSITGSSPGNRTCQQ